MWLSKKALKHHLDWKKKQAQNDAYGTHAIDDTIERNSIEMRRLANSSSKSEVVTNQIEEASDDEEDFTVHMQSWRSGDDEKTKKEAK